MSRQVYLLPLSESVLLAQITLHLFRLDSQVAMAMNKPLPIFLRLLPLRKSVLLAQITLHMFRLRRRCHLAPIILRSFHLHGELLRPT
jgi:hypothetical protein